MRLPATSKFQIKAAAFGEIHLSASGMSQGLKKLLLRAKEARPFRKGQRKGAQSIGKAWGLDGRQG
jgi:hypothetical protein